MLLMVEAKDGKTVGGLCAAFACLRLDAEETVTVEDLSSEALQTLADFIGVAETLRLWSHARGQRLYITARAEMSQQLPSLKPDSLAVLKRAFSPATLDIPLHPLSRETIERIAIRRLLAGQTKSRVAGDLGVSWKRIERIATRYGQDKLAGKLANVRSRAADTRRARTARKINSDGHLTRQDGRSDGAPSLSSQNTKKPASGHLRLV